MIKSVTDETFADITGMTLKSSSFLNLLPVEQDEYGTYLLNIFRSYTVNDVIKNDIIHYSLHTLNEEDWWENISYGYYNNVEQWWINAMLNDVINPFEEPEPGKEVKILKSDYITMLLREIKYRASEHV